MNQNSDGNSGERRPLTRAEFEAIYAEWWEAVFALLYRIVGNAAVTEELAQDTFVDLLVMKVNFSGDGPMRLLYKIAINKANQYFRRLLVNAKAMSQLVHHNGNGHPQSPAILAELRDEIARLRDTLAAQPDEDQELIQLKIEEEMTFSEIAARLDKPEGTAKSHYYRIIRNLHTQLSADDRTSSKEG